MNVVKVFNTTNHKKVAAKLHAYGFSIEALEVILSYLQGGRQNVKISTKLLEGVPQVVDLGAMPFNIYPNKLFFALNKIDISNFVDDTTP